jgi:hypothetical protein
MDYDFEELYHKAASVLNPRELSEHAQAETVAAAILTENGAISCHLVGVVVNSSANFMQTI